MLISFTELRKKSQTLLSDWQRYQSAPSFENFVEFAVSINSFTEFLIDKGCEAFIDQKFGEAINRDCKFNKIFETRCGLIALPIAQ